jgi:ABC-type transporter Mla subunit MlaD
MQNIEETIQKLTNLLTVKENYIKAQAKLIVNHEATIDDLRDQLAAANTVIAECKQFIDTLAKKEEELNKEVADLALLTS